MCASEDDVVVFFRVLFGCKEPFWLEVLGVTSRTLGADLRTLSDI